MIVTLTVNPSVDRTLHIDELRRGEVLRATAARVDPGGKGINVSRVLAAHGVKTRAVVAIGGPEGDHLAGLLEAAGIDVVPVPIAGSIRSNVTVVEPDGTITKLNEPGARLSETEVAGILDTAAAVAADAEAEWLVVSGSLPPGVPPSIYATLAQRLAGTATRLAVDTSGTALSAALAAGPALVKPNRHELAECVGAVLDTLGDVVDACRSLLTAGVGAVLASLGGQGAVLLRGDQVLHAHGPAAVPVSSVGAGDALLAGFLAAGGTGARALTEAVAWGGAAVALPGSRMPTPADLHGVPIVLDRRPRRDLRLLDSS